jgi:hypothetical protein
MGLRRPVCDVSGTRRPSAATGRRPPSSDPFTEYDDAARQRYYPGTMIAFFDESGSGESDYVALAACVGQPRHWSEFQRCWHEALRRHGAPYLHMREFAHFRGAYKGWSEPQRKALLSDLLDCLDSFPIAIVAACMKVSDYTCLPEPVQEAYRGPIYCCFQEIMRNLRTLSYLDSPLARTDVVYSSQDEYAPELRRLFGVYKSAGLEGKTFGTLQFADMRGSAGLQLADLAAYELRHYYYQKAKNRNQPARVPFRRLIVHNLVIPNAGTIDYIPGWAVQFQVARVWQVVLPMLWDNKHREPFRSMLMEMFPESQNIYPWIFRDVSAGYWDVLEAARVARLSPYERPEHIPRQFPRRRT